MEILGLSDSTPKPTSRLRELFWPQIDDDVAAVSAARNAMYASFVIAVGTALAAFSGNYSIWIDVALYVMIGIGVRQLSRAAALIGFILYGLSWLLVPSAMLSPAIVIRLILTALLLNGVRAANYAHGAHKSAVVDEIANPRLETAGLSRTRVAAEKLPGRLWPILRGPFFVALILLVLVNLASLSSIVFFQQWVLPTASMEKTLLLGDHIVTLRRWLMGDVQRGDILAFRMPSSPDQILVKRVVGVQGDRIKIANKVLYLNGTKLTEPYVQNITDYMDSYRDNFPSEPEGPVLYRTAILMLKDSVRNGEVVVPPGYYFVLGDNRDQSLDSRYWGFVPQASLLGRAVLVTYSYDKSVRREGRTLLLIPRIRIGVT
jgi:signal peptidase I